MWSSVSERVLSVLDKYSLVITLTHSADSPGSPPPRQRGSGLREFVLNCQNAGNFNVTASLNVTGLRKCRIHLRTVNRIHLALLMWSRVKDRFLPSQFIQTCFRTVYISLPGGLKFVSTAICTDMKNFFNRNQTQSQHKH